MYYVRPSRILLKTLMRQNCTAVSSCQQILKPAKHKFHLSNPTLNEKFLLDEKNKEIINENARLRKGVGNINLVHEINGKLKELDKRDNRYDAMNKELQDELRKIPNDTHPKVRDLVEPKVVALFNEMPVFSYEPKEFSEIGRSLNLLRTGHLGNFSGNKTYFLMSDLAELVIAINIHICEAALASNHFFSRNKPL